MFGFLKSVPDATEPPEVGNSSAGYENLTTILEGPDTADEVVEHFIADAIDAQQLPIVFGMAAGQQPVPPFLSRAIRFVLLSRDVSKPLELVRERWSIIRDILGEEKGEEHGFETFMKGWPDLEDLAADVVNGAFDVGESGLYAVLARSTTATNIITWCADGLPSVSREAWAEEIRSQGDLVELVMVLGDQRANIELGIAYFDALVDYAKSMAAGLAKVLPSQYWHTLFTLLQSEQRELYPRRIYEVLQRSAGTTAAEFFDLFGDMLSAHDLTTESRCMDQVCRPILTTPNARGLAWVADLAESNPALFTKNVDLAAANDFKARVRIRLDESPEEDPILRYLKRIGTALGLGSAEVDSKPQSEARPEDAGETGV